MSPSDLSLEWDAFQSLYGVMSNPTCSSPVTVEGRSFNPSTG